MFLNNSICVYDYESTSANPHTTQPIQLAAVMINTAKLEVIPGSEFNSLIKPIEDPEEQTKAGLGEIEAKALEVNGKTMEELRVAPSLKVVWSQFIQYVNNYNYKKDAWNAPIRAGYNICGFDNIITDRIAGPHGWGYGPWDKDRNRCTLFHPIHQIDLLQNSFMWFNKCAEPKKLSQVSILDFCGLDSEGSHDALQDVLKCGQLLCKFLKLHRAMYERINWSGK